MNLKWALWSAIKNATAAIAISNFIYFFFSRLFMELMSSSSIVFGLLKGVVTGVIYAIQVLPFSFAIAFAPGVLGWFMYCVLVIKIAGRVPALWKRNIIMVFSVFSSCFIVFGWWSIVFSVYISVLGLVGALVLVNKKHVSYYSYLVD